MSHFLTIECQGSFGDCKSRHVSANDTFMQHPNIRCWPTCNLQKRKKKTKTTMRVEDRRAQHLAEGVYCYTANVLRGSLRGCPGGKAE